MDALRLMTANTPTRNHDEIERLLSCPICLEIFTKPVVILPCQHNLCRDCANDMYENRGTPMGSGGRFKCPSCRHEVVLDRHGVYGLQRNLLVENIIDMYQSEGRKSSFRKVEQSVMCEDHEEEKVNIYCTTCQKPTCSLCKVFGQHQDCEVAPMEKIYKEQKSDISNAIAMLASGNDQLQSIISQTEELSKRTQANGQKVQRNVNDAFDLLHRKLEERKSSMLSRLDEDIQERNQVLAAMLKNYKQQLDGGSKLMTASLSLADERSIPQFLKLSREMVEKVLEVVSASEIRKPPFNIQSMGEFHVNFHFQKEMLSKLDFTPLTEDNLGDDASDEDETDPVAFTSVHTECEVIEEEDSDALRSTETTPKINEQYIKTAEDIFRLPLLKEDKSEKNEREEQTVVTDPQPEVKQGRWYDKFVRQLPAPITMSGFSAPMESSVHMKVVIPATTDDTGEDIEQLKKENEVVATTESNVSEDIDDLDLEIEQLLAPRRRRWASRFRYSPDISPTASPTQLVSHGYGLDGDDSPSPRVSPIFSLRHRRPRDASPTSSKKRPTLNRSDRYRSSSPSSAKHLQSRKDSVGSKEQRHRSKSPTQRSASPTSSDLGRTQERGTDSPSNSQSARRPRVYCTHKRRTWSHLLNKR